MVVFFNVSGADWVCQCEGTPQLFSYICCNFRKIVAQNNMGRGGPPFIDDCSIKSHIFRGFSSQPCLITGGYLFPCQLALLPNLPFDVSQRAIHYCWLYILQYSFPHVFFPPSFPQIYNYIIIYLSPKLFPEFGHPDIFLQVTVIFHQTHVRQIHSVSTCFPQLI